MCQFGTAGGSQEIEIDILFVELACKFITLLDPKWKVSIQQSIYIVPTQYKVIPICCCSGIK